MIDLSNLPTGSTWTGTISRDEAGRLHISGTLESNAKPPKPEPIEEPMITWDSVGTHKRADLFSEAPPPAPYLPNPKERRIVRLTKAQAGYIRNSKEKTSVLASAFGVTANHIASIQRGRFWKSLP